MDEGNVESLIDRAEELYRYGHADESISIYNKLIESGINAYSKIGYIYVQGKEPVEQCVNKAVDYFKVGIEKYNCYECKIYYAGILVHNGNYEDVLKADKLFEEAEKQEPELSMVIYQIYTSNENIKKYIKKSKDKANKFLVKADKYGFCLAKTYLAKYYFDEKEYIKYLYKRIDSVYCVIYAYIMSFVNKEKLQSIYDFQVVPKKQNVPSNDSK